MVLDRAATFILMQLNQDGSIRYLRDKIGNGTTPGIMSSTLEADVMKSTAEINSETYVNGVQGEGFLELISGVFESKFLLHSFHIGESPANPMNVFVLGSSFSRYF